MAPFHLLINAYFLLESLLSTENFNGQLHLAKGCCAHRGKMPATFCTCVFVIIEPSRVQKHLYY